MRRVGFCRLGHTKTTAGSHGASFLFQASSSHVAEKVGQSNFSATTAACRGNRFMCLGSGLGRILPAKVSTVLDQPFSATQEPRTLEAAVSIVFSLGAAQQHL
jgi:hypothetical protein